MPSQGTQVYWHNLPIKRPPWRNTAELRTCIQESRQAATSVLHVPWDGVHHSGIKRQRRCLTEEAQIRRAGIRQRMLAVQQLENPRIHRGVVPEPNATPLRVVNLIMAHLGQRMVSHEEAVAAVDKIILHYNTLTQLSQTQVTQAGFSQSDSPQQPRGDSVAGRRRRGPSRRYDPVAAATASVLSQSQPEDLLGSTESNSSTRLSQSATNALAAAKRRGAGLGTDMQNSLVLDVIEELCNGRSLCFKRLSRADLRSMNYKVTSLEAVPHRRVVLLADRRDPYFVVLFGLQRGVKPEPFVVATLKEDGLSPSSLKCYSRTEIPHTQVFCVAPAPVPWRRVWKSISISTYRSEFAVAVVELDAGKETEAKEWKREGTEAAEDVKVTSADAEQTMETGNTKRVALGKSGTAASPAAPVDKSSPLRVWQTQPPRMPDLLGVESGERGWGSDEDEDKDDLWHITFFDATAATQDSALAVESKWIKSDPMFEAQERALPIDNVYGFYDTAGDDVGHLDPLQRLPRTDARDCKANAKIAAWYRRLLPKHMAAELMGRLRDMHHKD